MFPVVDPARSILGVFLLLSSFIQAALNSSIQLPSALRLLLVEKVCKVDLVEAEQETFGGNLMGLLESRSNERKGETVKQLGV